MNAPFSPKHKLVARKVQFDFSDSPVDWIPEDKLASHVINGVNLLLPAGEFWFCRVYNKVLPYIRDEQLKEEVLGFIRQEAIHGRTHLQAQQFLEQHGYDLQPALKRINWVFEKLLGEAPFGIAALNRPSLEKPWLFLRVGLIAAIEHFTGVLGQWSLDNSSWDKADPVIADLFRWHLAEEVEHRTVAFDLYEHIIGHEAGFYWSRQALMVLMYPLFILALMGTARSLGQQDEDQAIKRLMSKNILSFLWKFEQNANTTKHIPSLSFITKATIRWISPRFHPIHEGNTQQALDYMARSPAVQALGLH
ncbi:metal-dependent hydrolase [Alkanindiges sp. WGS2144]|uniref:metal-dependent hydrolase n=1 Tax=Alkanindiges sp. WGS2144 TaxID=3366808 RepID=UPI0037515379